MADNIKIITGIQKSEKQTGFKRPDWLSELTIYRYADNRKAVFQLLNTVIPYLFLWYLMIRWIQSGFPFIVIPVLMLLAAGFLVRIFILFHDCVHGSFFKSKRLNKIAGNMLGLLVFTSFDDWRFSHLRHHTSYGNLNTRGYGDIWTLTLKEYKSLPWYQKLLYRFYRNPVVFMILGALYMFLLNNRFPTQNARRKEKMNVIYTNTGIAIVVLIVSLLIGWRMFLLIQLPVLWFAGMAGIWLFYVQHQFPGGYWSDKDNWQPFRAALEGSSFYKLPGILRWFSGNIGYHHVHHLSHKIPNYHLKKCYDAVPGLQKRKPLSIMESISCIHLKLWDETRGKMITFPLKRSD